MGSPSSAPRNGQVQNAVEVLLQYGMIAMACCSLPRRAPLLWGASAAYNVDDVGDKNWASAGGAQGGQKDVESAVVVNWDAKPLSHSVPTPGNEPSIK